MREFISIKYRRPLFTFRLRSASLPGWPSPDAGQKRHSQLAGSALSLRRLGAESEHQRINLIVFRVLKYQLGVRIHRGLKLIRIPPPCFSV